MIYEAKSKGGFKKLSLLFFVFFCSSHSLFLLYFSFLIWFYSWIFAFNLFIFYIIKEIDIVNMIQSIVEILYIPPWYIILYSYIDVSHYSIYIYWHDILEVCFDHLVRHFSARHDIIAIYPYTNMVSLSYASILQWNTS